MRTRSGGRRVRRSKARQPSRVRAGSGNRPKPVVTFRTRHARLKRSARVRRTHRTKPCACALDRLRGPAPAATARGGASRIMGAARFMMPGPKVPPCPCGRASARSRRWQPDHRVGDGKRLRVMGNQRSLSGPAPRAATPAPLPPRSGCPVPSRAHRESGSSRRAGWRAQWRCAGAARPRGFRRARRRPCHIHRAVRG